MTEPFCHFGRIYQLSPNFYQTSSPRWLQKYVGEIRLGSIKILASGTTRLQFDFQLRQMKNLQPATFWGKYNRAYCFHYEDKKDLIGDETEKLVKDANNKVQFANKKSTPKKYKKGGIETGQILKRTDSAKSTDSKASTLTSVFSMASIKSNRSFSFIKYKDADEKDQKDQNYVYVRSISAASNFSTEANDTPTNRLSKTQKFLKFCESHKFDLEKIKKTNNFFVIEFQNPNIAKHFDICMEQRMKEIARRDKIENGGRLVLDFSDGFPASGFGNPQYLRYRPRNPVCRDLNKRKVNFLLKTT